MNSTPYLDNAATTRLEPEVFEAMQHYFVAEFGNAGSRTHSYGSAAARAVDAARAQVAEVLGAAPEDVIFTSGATESNNLAIQGLEESLRSAGRQHVITTAIEHKAVLEPCDRLEQRGFEVTRLPVGRSGRVAVADLQRELRADTGLVSVMHVNNETGIVQPIREFADALGDHPAYLHVDAAQGFGKELDHVRAGRVDLVSISAHKLYGPKGVGALIVRARPGGSRPALTPLVVGGGQERGLRAGTLPVALIVGLGEACRLAIEHHEERWSRSTQFANALLDTFSRLGGQINGDRSTSIPHIINVSFDGLDSEAFLVGTKDLVAVSNGAACSSTQYRTSHVLEAMGVGDLAANAIRFSVSHFDFEVDLNELESRIQSLRL